VVGNIVAVIVIPIVGNLSDKVGRKPLIITGAIGSGLLSYVYLYAISIHNLPLAVVASLLMWGVVYQGYNAVYPSFYPELFPTRTRVSGMAISQNLGTAVTALLPVLFVTVAPPGSANIPMVIGTITLGVTIVAALAAWSARETYRIHLNDLGDQNAAEVPKPEYDRLRERTLNEPHLAKA
jgi:MFS family permease